MATRKTLTLNLSEAEMAVLEQMSEKKEMSKTAVLRQALRLYQAVDVRLARGERMVFEGSKEKAELMLL